MIKVTKEFNWDCAHLLDGHRGLCKNLHGHTYKMEVTAQRALRKSLRDALSSDTSPSEVSTCGPDEGMVLDFKELKNIVNELVVVQADHAFIYNSVTQDPFETALYDLCIQYEKKVMVVHYRPTAENMAKHYLHLIQDEAVAGDYDWEIVSVKLWETPTSYAEATF